MYVHQVNKKVKFARTCISFDVESKFLLDDFKFGEGASLVSHLKERRAYMSQHRLTVGRMIPIGWMSRLYTELLSTDEVEEMIERTMVASRAYEAELNSLHEQPTEQFQLILRVRRGIKANVKEAASNKNEKAISSDVLEILVPAIYKKAATEGMLEIMEQQEVARCGEFIPYASRREMGEKVYGRLLLRYNEFLQNVRRIAIGG